MLQIHRKSVTQRQQLQPFIIEFHSLELRQKMPAAKINEISKRLDRHHRQIQWENIHESFLLCIIGIIIRN